MSRPTELTGKKLQAPRQKHIDAGAILLTLGDRPRKKAVKILNDMGIHEDYINDALKGKPFGAKVIDLAEYRWMRLFDEL